MFFFEFSPKILLASKKRHTNTASSLALNVFLMVMGLEIGVVKFIITEHDDDLCIMKEAGCYKLCQDESQRIFYF